MARNRLPPRLFLFSLLLLLASSLLGDSEAWVSFNTGIDHFWVRKLKTCGSSSNNHQWYRRQNIRLDKIRYHATQNQEPENDQDRKSIADYTLGLHGGKYQFDQGGGSSALNSMGQAFAESLYGSTDDTLNQSSLEEEPLPQWAVRLSQQKLSDIVSPQTVVLSLAGGDAVATGELIITNQEMTWERFYAFVVQDETASETMILPSNEPPFLVTPRVGMLERRGGKARIQVSSSTTTTTLPPGATGWWILVGTEEESWAYRIVIE